MKSSKLAVAAMFGLVFMVGFVTMFTGPMGAVVKAQFGASNALAMFGASANFLAYLFMGIPGGMVVKRRGYKFSALLAVAIGFAGVALQMLSGLVGSFAVYVAGAFVAGLSMCLLNVTANPLLNELGGGGNGGNRLVQYGCTFNSFGGMASPMVLGWFIGGEIAKARVIDVLPAQALALFCFVAAFVALLFTSIPEPHLEAKARADAPPDSSMWSDFAAMFRFRHFALGVAVMFLFEPIEAGIPQMAMLYMTAEGAPAYVGAAVAGTLVTLYCACMMLGRFLGGLLGGRVTARTMLSFCALACIALLVAVINVPLVKVPVPFVDAAIPLSMALMALCGVFTSVMFGGLINLALECLGRYVPMASGILMSTVFGGSLLALQGLFADRFGILESYYVTIVLLAAVFAYARWGSKPRA